ncbi:MAG TPA: VWA domain-containing protein [Pyrinomonadaceae bacterium]
MRRTCRPLVSLSLCCVCLAHALGQTGAPAPPAVDDEQVVRVTSSLVQVDAVVLDAEGRQVTDLRAEDFEVFEDGRPQVVTNFAYVGGAAGPAGAPSGAAGKAAPTAAAGASVPPSAASPSAPRSFFVVVDDLALSPASASMTRQALLKFVEGQLLPGDQVVISHTRKGTGAFQKLTSDRQVLHAAIESIFYRCPNRVGSCVPTDPSYTPRSRAESLEAIKLVLTKLRGLPGRKSLIIFSDDLVITPQPDDALFSEGSPLERDLDAAVERAAQGPPKSVDEGHAPYAPYGIARQVIDLANRASVTIHAVDTRGLVAYAPGSPDAATPGRSLYETMRARGFPTAQTQQGTIDKESAKLLATQEGLRLLAEGTGGHLTYNTNDLSRGTARMLEEARGYYLLGYRPEVEPAGAAGERPRFHRLQIRVKRPGLTVRARKGFFDAPDARGRTDK